MTTPDPSREAFEQHYLPEASPAERSRIFRIWPDGRYFNGYTQARYEGWQAAMAHKGTELEQAHEARRQAQAELADMQEKRNRIGLDIDRALRGEVNEQSPIAGRLKLIAEAAAPKQEGST